MAQGPRPYLISGVAAIALAATVPALMIVAIAFRAFAAYYSEADWLGSVAIEPAHSQAYLSHVASRAVFIIRADNPAIGLVGFVPVGMSEVNSCVIHPSIEPGHHVVKGEELGHFQFGGSTHCLVFGPGVLGDFAMTAIPQPHDPGAPLVLVRSRLATVAPKAPPRPDLPSRLAGCAVRRSGEDRLALPRSRISCTSTGLRARGLRRSVS